MSPAKKRATKTTKKVTRKAASKKAPKAGTKKKAAAARAKNAPAKKTKGKTAKKTAKRGAAKTAAKPRRSAAPSKPPAEGAPREKAGSAARLAKAIRTKKREAVAQPLESAEKKPGLGAKWACFNCGAKFYDLNRPDPICPRCHADQREQPAKAVVAAPSPTSRRAATPPISRLLDEEESAEPTYEEDSEAEGAAELDMGKLNEEVEYLDDSEFTEESDD